MSVIASCGHTLTEEEGFGYEVNYLEWDESEQTLVTASFCRACHDQAHAEGWALTPKQVEQWLHN